MDFVFGTEHEELRSATRDLLRVHSPESAVRAAMETEEGFDRVLWLRMAGEIGLQGLAVPEALGGAGAGNLELGVVMEELGRALYCGPFLSTVVLASGILSLDDAAAERYLPRIATGDLIATVASARLLDPDSDAQIPTVRSRGTGPMISGRVDFVLDGQIADLVIVEAVDDGDRGFYLVETNSPEVHHHALPTMDQTRRFAAVEFTDAPAVRLDLACAVSTVIDQMRDDAVIALAAEQVGGAQHMLDLSVDYARVRVQFGRTIGSFQSIKHRCAEMSIDVEGARSAAYAGMWAVANDLDKGQIAVSAAIAHSHCSETFTRVAAGAIQIHGGIGFTWEHAAHLYYKRAKSSELLFGSPATHRRRLAHALELV